ncbi:MAG: hypothetical protein ACKO2Z_23020 [Sphaerospermopsis kisseleviana]
MTGDWAINLPHLPIIPPPLFTQQLVIFYLQVREIPSFLKNLGTLSFKIQQQNY